MKRDVGASHVRQAPAGRTQCNSSTHTALQQTVFQPHCLAVWEIRAKAVSWKAPTPFTNFPSKRGRISTNLSKVWNLPFGRLYETGSKRTNHTERQFVSSCPTLVLSFLQNQTPLHVSKVKSRVWRRRYIRHASCSTGWLFYDADLPPRFGTVKLQSLVSRWKKRTTNLLWYNFMFCSPCILV
jgi:hypothetical protein